MWMLFGEPRLISPVTIGEDDRRHLQGGAKGLGGGIVGHVLSVLERGQPGPRDACRLTVGFSSPGSETGGSQHAEVRSLAGAAAR